MLDSSPDQKTDDQGVAQAESPTADELGRKSLSDVLTEAMGGDDAPAAAEAETAGDADPEESPAPETTAETEDESKGESEEEADEEAEEGDEKLPFHKHPRWQQQQAKLKEAEAKLSELETKASEGAEDLERYHRLTTFCESNELTNEDVNTAFEAMAAIKGGDAETVLKILEPYYQQAAQASGKMLPDDLRDEVESGGISEERAVEIARLRARQQVAAAAEKPASEKVDPAVQLRASASAVQAIENQLLKTDPDYQGVRDDVVVYFKDWFRTLTAPPTTDETVEAFHRIVGERKKKALNLGGSRSKAAVKSRPDVAGRPSAKPVQQNGSLLDMLKAAV